MTIFTEKDEKPEYQFVEKRHQPQHPVRYGSFYLRLGAIGKLAFKILIIRFVTLINTPQNCVNLIYFSNEAKWTTYCSAYLHLYFIMKTNWVNYQ